jgi:hypothetical protein
MQIPAVDRTPYQRPASVDVVSHTVGKVVPVAPVNPIVSAPVPTRVQSSPDVIDLVNRANKPTSGEGVYFSVSDPAKRGSEAATAEKDWTIHRPETVKTETPPPEPISKMLMAFLRDMWRASASAIEAQIAANDAKTQVQNPVVAPGTIAKEILTYSPTKISGTEKSLSSNAGRDPTSRG